MLISLFCLSELESWVVKKYLQQYVVHARRGYIQLNYDEPGAALNSTLTAMELFREIYTIQASAVMLPPPPCGVHKHHRIVWGPRSNDEGAQQKGPTS